MLEKDATEPNRERSDALRGEKDVTSELTRETDRELLELLVEQSPLHVMDIAATADRHPITVDQTCARLHEQGYVFPQGRGRYTVTEDGKRRIGEECDP